MLVVWNCQYYNNNAGLEMLLALLPSYLIIVRSLSLLHFARKSIRFRVNYTNYAGSNAAYGNARVRLPVLLMGEMTVSK